MTADQLELEAMNWLVETGYTHICGYDIAPLHGFKVGGWRNDGINH